MPQGGRGRVRYIAKSIGMTISFRAIVRTCSLFNELLVYVSAPTGFLNKHEQMKVTHHVV